MGDDIRWFRKQLETLADNGGQVALFTRLLDIWVARGMSVWSRGSCNGCQKRKPLILIARDRLIAMENESDVPPVRRFRGAHLSDSVQEIYDLLKRQAFKDFKRDLFRYVEKGRLDTVKQILDFKNNVFISKKIGTKEISLLAFAKEKARQKHGKFAEIYVLLVKYARDTQKDILFQSIRIGDLETIRQIVQYDEKAPFLLENNKNIVEVAKETPNSETFKKTIEAMYTAAIYYRNLQHIKQNQADIVAFSYVLPNWSEKTMTYVKKKTNTVPIRLLRRTWHKKEPVFGRVKKILGYVAIMRRVQQR